MGEPLDWASFERDLSAYFDGFAAEESAHREALRRVRARFGARLDDRGADTLARLSCQLRAFPPGDDATRLFREWVAARHGSVWLDRLDELG